MRDVDDVQAAMLASAMHAQRRAIMRALSRLADELRFEEEAAVNGGPAATWPDVLRLRREHERAFLFVGHARGFSEPASDPSHRRIVRKWLRRFARLLEHRRGKRDGRIHGGYLIVGAPDASAAGAWASRLSSMARTHQLQRDGALAHFVVRPLGEFWMAC